jgi:hypothetical protein
MSRFGSLIHGRWLLHAEIFIGKTQTYAASLVPPCEVCMIFFQCNFDDVVIRCTADVPFVLQSETFDLYVADSVMRSLALRSVSSHPATVFPEDLRVPGPSSPAKLRHWGIESVPHVLYAFKTTWYCILHSSSS